MIASMTDSTAPEVRWFAWWEIQPAFAHGRAGGIALHRFRYDLRRFGLGPHDPACHILSTNRAALVRFAGGFGLSEARIQPPRAHRPDVWHFDAFGQVLERLEAAFPPPDDLDLRHCTAAKDSLYSL
jgi:hypothetical protein